jgi:hypothetical protein
MGRGYYTLETRKSSAEYFFFFFLFGESIYHPPLILMKGKATPPVLYPPPLPQSFRSTRRALQDIYFFSSSFSGGDACSNTFRVPFLFALCVCVDIKSSAWQTQAQDGRRDSVVPNFSQTRPMRLTPSVTECFLRPTWTEIKRNK